jgi:hypothetical protein
MTRHTGEAPARRYSAIASPSGYSWPDHGLALSPYKRFYSGAQGEIGEARKEIRGGLGAGSGLPGGNRFLSGRKPGNSLPALSSPLSARDRAGGQAHLDPTGAWPACGRPLCDAGHHCRERARAHGGARGSKGSFALQPSLSRWRRMPSTTRGSVIKETIRIRAPQAHSRGSTSKIFLSRRAHVLRASLE